MTPFRKLLRVETGATLIELLATLSILLLVLGTMTVLMISATKSEVDLTRRVEAQLEARLALEMVRHETHEACVASHIDLATGSVIAPGTPYFNVRLTPPTAGGCPATTDPATAVTWCTSGSGSRWTLRRVVGTPTSCAGGRPEADFITTASVFTLAQPPGSLATLNVNFPVDVDPLSAVGGAYRLQDDLVLRNSQRTP